MTRTLTHQPTGTRTAWCHRCMTHCCDRAYAYPDRTVCDCCKGHTYGNHLGP